MAPLFFNLGCYISACSRVNTKVTTFGRRPGLLFLLCTRDFSFEESTYKSYPHHVHLPSIPCLFVTPPFCSFLSFPRHPRVRTRKQYWPWAYKGGPTLKILGSLDNFAASSGDVLRFANNDASQHQNVILSLYMRGVCACICVCT